jgi:D-beta-D-heptose 7-phosphate kinase/D-beta-D-heptose 1-phosphate adenosyltransferase
MPAPDIALRPVDRQRALDAVRRFAGVPVLIVGDLMLDHFVFGRVNRISPEAPVPVVEFDREDFRVGGAGNVAHNVRALGGTVEVVGVIGRDHHGAHLKDALRAGDVGIGGVVTEDGRPTTRKMRLVTSRNQQVARVDYETDREAKGEVEAALIAALERASATAKAIVISDYLKGSVTRSLVARAVGIARDLRVPLLIDPKIPHLDYYAGATLLTPNNSEAEAASHTRIRTNTEAQTAARVIRDRMGCKSVLITRGESGMWLLDETGEGHLPAATREVADVTGAGDTVIATLALALATGADLVEAATLANAAAGISVTRFGPSAVSADELRSAFS